MSHDSAAIHRARQLEYVSITWMLIEGGVGIAAGVIAGSIALLGFGIDSLIEIFSGAVSIWRLREGVAREARERAALKLVGFSFFGLAAYVLFDAMRDFVFHRRPDTSAIGIALACIALILMPLLARAKRRVAVKLKSRALQADSRQTDFCAYFAGILLSGLVFNALFGWWWADPLAALCMLPLIFREGIEALQGRSCCE